MSIILESYDVAWPQHYQEEVDRLTKQCALREVRFLHIGSTSVTDMLAKLTIDMMCGVQDIKSFHQRYARCLAKLGYQYIQEVEIDFPFRRYYQLLDEKGNHLFHLHVVVYRSSWWQRHACFKNILNDDIGLRQSYAELKKKLVSQVTSRDQYTNQKGSFILNAIQQYYTKPAAKMAIVEDDIYAGFVPQLCLLDQIEALYVNREHNMDLILAQWAGEQVKCWDEYGAGVLWWWHKPTQQWRLVAGYVPRLLDPTKLKWQCVSKIDACTNDDVAAIKKLMASFA